MNYIVRCISILDSNTMEFRYDNFEDARRQVRHLKDLGANSQIIRLYETVSV